MGRVRYGLSNLYYAIATDDGTGTLTYANPVKIPGAKSIALDPQGDSTDEYADDVLWLHIDGNNGYSGDLEFEDTADGAAFYNAVSGAVFDSGRLRCRLEAFPNRLLRIRINKAKALDTSPIKVINTIPKCFISRRNYGTHGMTWSFT